jgi:hypothetical protein
LDSLLHQVLLGPLDCRTHEGGKGRKGGTGWNGVYTDFLLDATDDRQNVGFGCMKAFSKARGP